MTFTDQTFTDQTFTDKTQDPRVTTTTRTRYRCQNAAATVAAGWVVLLLTTSTAHGASGDVQAHLQLVVGTQNLTLRVGVYAFGVADTGAFAAEGGAALWAETHLLRWGARTTGVATGYDAFALLGAGQNDNFLGSTIPLTQPRHLYRPGRPGTFVGVGAGVHQLRPSGSLRKFGMRRGNFLFRVADGDRTAHVNFANDLRLGPFQGSARDQGPTGTLRVGYARIDRERLQHVSTTFEMFTPEPDYQRAPSNPQNSDDGAKRSWYTTAPWDRLFHANLYVTAGEQDKDGQWSISAGYDSPRLGAYVQNRIHDGFGLYPRYPWPVEDSGRLFLEASVGRFRE